MPQGGMIEKIYSWRKSILASVEMVRHMGVYVCVLCVCMCFDGEKVEVIL